MPQIDRSLDTILLVEDNHDDYEATIRSFRKAELKNPVHWCENGSEALDYLFRQGRYANDASVQTPCLILLDLNMPGVDGRAILKTIKSDKRTQSIPTIVLTTSSAEVDINQCYDLGASTYIQKPVAFEGLISAAERIKDYWFGLALLPEKT